MAAITGALIAAFVIFAFAPGLTGGFLFDDFVNLPALGEFGGIRDLKSLVLYLTSGFGDPLGRPLSLLSFLIDAQNWPADPASFLRTNIVIHGINSVLLFSILLKLGSLARIEAARVNTAAVIGAACWSLHPFLLSTVLYIVQRETMLAATFVFAGIWVWLRGLEMLRGGRNAYGITLLAVAAFPCTLLASLSKANGCLLPLLLLTIEMTVAFGRDDSPQLQLMARRRRIVLALLASTVIAALIFKIPSFETYANEFRPWTLRQRLLSEPRILLQYLVLLFLPRPLTGGIFHDDIAPSTDLLDPWTTLPAAICVVTSIFWAWRIRNRHPLIALGILFFFVGHSMESTFVPLELYFEHRNYLPFAFIPFPIAVWLSRRTIALVGMRLATAAIVLAALFFETHEGASVWGRPSELALAWATRNPDSSRAQAYEAQFEMARGDFIGAKKRLAAATIRAPDDTQLTFNLVDAECGNGEVSPQTLLLVNQSLSRTRNSGLLDYSWISQSVERARTGKCVHFDLTSLETMLASLRSNQAFKSQPGRQQDFDNIEGQIELAEGAPQEALLSFNRALSRWPRPSIALGQASSLATAGYPKLALAHLNFFGTFPTQTVAFGLAPSQLHAWLLQKFAYWPNELAHLHDTLISDNAR